MGSRMIRVLKRDGSAEAFSSFKLAASMWRAMLGAGQGRYRDAADLGAAIGIYLRTSQCTCVSTAALFEMGVRVLRRVRMDRSADAMEEHSRRRARMRQRVRVAHGGRKITWWDKGWLARLGRASWNLMPATARTIAGLVEARLLDGDKKLVDRSDAMEMFNACVVEYGLADAVPVEQ